MCVPTSVVHKNTLFKGLENWRCFFPKNLASLVPKKMSQAFFGSYNIIPMLGRVIIQSPPGSTNMARSGALLLILGMIFDGQRGITREGLGFFWKVFGVSSTWRFFCCPLGLLFLDLNPDMNLKEHPERNITKSVALWAISGTASVKKLHPSRYCQ